MRIATCRQGETNSDYWNGKNIKFILLTDIQQNTIIIPHLKAKGYYFFIYFTNYYNNIHPFMCLRN